MFFCINTFFNHFTGINRPKTDITFNEDVSVSQMAVCPSDLSTIRQVTLKTPHLNFVARYACGGCCCWELFLVQDREHASLFSGNGYLTFATRQVKQICTTEAKVQLVIMPGRQTVRAAFTW